MRTFAIPPRILPPLPAAHLPEQLNALPSTCSSLPACMTFWLGLFSDDCRPPYALYYCTFLVWCIVTQTP